MKSLFKSTSHKHFQLLSVQTDLSATCLRTGLADLYIAELEISNRITIHRKKVPSKYFDQRSFSLPAIRILNSWQLSATYLQYIYSFVGLKLFLNQNLSYRFVDFSRYLGDAIRFSIRPGTTIFNCCELRLTYLLHIYAMVRL